MLGASFLALALIGCRPAPPVTSGRPVAGIACRVEAHLPCDECASIRVGGELLRVESRPLFASGDILEISRAPDLLTGERTLVIRFTENRGRRLGYMTSRFIGRRVVLMVDRRVISSSTLRSPFGENMQITGLSNAEIDGHFAQLADTSAPLR